MTTKKYITVYGIDAHGGFGMNNEGCDAAERHFGHTHDGELWYDTRWLTVDSDFGGDARDVDSVILKVGDIMEMDETSLKYVKQAFTETASETPIECGGEWRWIWEYEEDDFYEQVAEAGPPQCPKCGKPMTLNRYAFEGDTRLERVITTNSKPATRHWLYYCCWSYTAVASNEVIE